ncbi:MAG: sigma-54-dependent transcriptional regulator [Fidelibacterota bacterium]
MGRRKLTDEVPELIGKSRKITQIRNAIEKIAKIDSPLLLFGETGTGKERIAGLIHSKSTRSEENFVSFNCLAYSKDILETSLFGEDTQKGEIDNAFNGTLFINNIEELSHEAQSILLSIIERKKFKRINSRKTIDCDIRLLGGTTKNVDELKQNYKFNQDLLFSLSRIFLNIPPLRERKEDIPVLIQHFVKNFSKEFGIEIPVLSSNFVEMAMKPSWVGNVYQLESCIRTALILSQEKELDLMDLPVEIFKSEPDFILNVYNLIKTNVKNFKQAINEIEAKIINIALMENNYNQYATAMALGLKEPTIREKMVRFGIKSSRQRLWEKRKRKRTKK